jgi:lipoprotein-releasing system permease protein
MIQGWVLGLVGSTIGVALGVLVSINVESIVSFIEGVIGSEILSSEVYYISTITSDVRINEVAYFYILSILLSVMATSIPAAIASKIEIYKGMKG